MSEDKLTLAKRTITGKKVKTLRKEDLIPSVIYGGDKEPVLAQSPYNPTEKALRKVGYHSPIDLNIAGKPQMALVKNVDVDPVKRTIQNIEFQAISADEIVEATTPIIIVNFEASEAAKLKYSTIQVMEEIEVKAKPADLPKGIELDASHLATLEDRLVVSDIKLGKNVELADKELDPEQIIVSLFDPVAEAAAREAAEKAAEQAAAAAAPTEETATPATDTPSPESATPSEPPKSE